MKQQIPVVNLVEAALGIEETDVVLQLLAALKGFGELVDDRGFLRGQLIGIRRIHGREIGVLQRIDRAVDGDAAVCVINLIQQKAIFHAVFRMSENLLPFQLEKDNRDGLVHAGGEQLVLLGIMRGVRLRELHGKAGYVAVFVDLIGKNREGTQRDAVTCLQNLEVVVVDGVGEHGGHQGTTAGSGAHPENVVVAPLDIHAVIVQERVHDDVRPGTAVKDVADDVHMVHGQPLDHRAERGDEIRRLADFDDGGDDVLIVFLLVKFITVGVQQFLNDVCVVRGQGLADLGAGVARAYAAAELDKTIESDAVPLIQVVDLGLELLQLLLGIDDQGGELVQLRAGNAVLEEHVQPLPDDAGAGVENMEKGLVFSVYVGDEVLAAFRKIQDCLQVDDLGSGGAERGILPGEHSQIAQLLCGIGFMLFHHVDSPCSRSNGALRQLANGDRIKSCRGTEGRGGVGIR